LTNPTSEFQVRFKVWIERDGEVVLSDWRIALLEAIGRLGSLRAAALELNVPYRTAWKKLQESEARLGEHLVIAEPGGADGGHSRLTDAALAWIARYRAAVGNAPEVLATAFDRGD
jgi:molybdate transport system regulatory protein